MIRKLIFLSLASLILAASQLLLWQWIETVSQQVAFERNEQRDQAEIVSQADILAANERQLAEREAIFETVAPTEDQLSANIEELELIASQANVDLTVREINPDESFVYKDLVVYRVVMLAQGDPDRLLFFAKLLENREAFTAIDSFNIELQLAGYALTGEVLLLIQEENQIATTIEVNEDQTTTVTPVSSGGGISLQVIILTFSIVVVVFGIGLVLIRKTKKNE